MENNTILLGKIKEIHQYKLLISLPHNKSGVCQLTNISEKYRSILESMTKNDENDESAPSLSEMFVVGQTVVAKTMKTTGNKMIVSLVPADVNAAVNVRHVKSCGRLHVAIESREDKGFILETGVKGLRGFLSFDKCRGRSLKVGQLVEVSPINTGAKDIKSNSKVINFIITDDSLSANILSSTKAIEFSCIFPGMLLKVNLKLSSEANLEGSFHGFSVSIKRNHQKNNEQHNDEQTVCVIGVDSTLKQFDCSTLPHLFSPYEGAEELVHLQIGHSEPNCTVQKINKTQTIFKLPKMKFSRAIVKKDHLDISLKDIKVGENTTIRYLDYNLIDNVIQATTIKRLLSLSYFSVHQAKLGEVIKATVKGFKKNGFAVQISSQLSGFIPSFHLSDKEIRTPALALKSGDVIKCRVFHIDHEKNKLILTLKKSFLKSSLATIGSISDLRSGMLLDGFVAKIGDYGLLVIMFNNLKGWVRKSQIPKSEQTNLSISFHVGRPVQVRIIGCDNQTGKISLSLLSTDNEDENVEEESEAVVQVKVGQIFECIIKKVMKNGFNIRLMPSNKPAFLKFDQLSDSREHCTLLKCYFSMCEKKELRTNVVVINSDNKLVYVSRKHSFINGVSNGRMLTSESFVTIGSQWLGWVIRKESFGVFVELPTGIVGLVPTKNICDYQSVGCSLIDLLQEGDTVEAKVIEFDSNKPTKSLFTLKMSETYKIKDNMGSASIDFLSNHLEERKFIKSSEACHKVKNIEIGDLVDVKVTGQLDWGFTLSVEDSIPGFVKNQHLPSTALMTNNVRKAVIIDIDLAQQSVEVCMTGSIVKGVEQRNNQCTKVELKQHIKSEVLVFNSDFVVAMMLGHASGNIVFIPTKRFWNDVSKEFSWIINQRNMTVVKRALCNDRFIGTLSINEAIADVKKPVIKSIFKTLNKKIRLVTGEVYEVYFHSLTKNKVFLSFSKTQKCFCDLFEFSESVIDIEQLMINPPEKNSVIERKIRITDTGNKGTGLSRGHLLKKETIEVGDMLCGKVIADINNHHKLRVQLPFNNLGEVNFIKNENNGIQCYPKMGKIIQCRVEKINEPGHKVQFGLSIVKVQNFINETELANGDALKLNESTNKITKLSKYFTNNEVEDEMPQIIYSKKKEIAEQETLSQVYKRVHEDEEECNDEDVDNNDEKPSSSKRQKIEKISLAEKELCIREAEKRRETGDILKNPQSETEFELLVFNYPNCANTWTRYMDFILSEQQDVDKTRAIAERAMKTLSTRDVDNRYMVMVKYIDLELEQLAKNKEEIGFEDQMKKFQVLFQRCLISKPRAFYIHVCDKSRLLKLYDLSEKVCKSFVKEFHYDPVAWFKLIMVRFEQKKITVVKDTLINAQRLLKAEHYRDLQINFAQLELDNGFQARAEKIIKDLIESRPKDLVLKKKCNVLLKNAGLLNDEIMSGDDE